MAEGGMREEAYIPRMTGQLEFIHSVSHINLLNTFFRLRRLASWAMHCLHHEVRYWYCLPLRTTVRR